MPTTLLQAAVGAGKTEAALNYLSNTLSNPDKPFAKVWVLLATKRQEVAFRQRLIDLHDGRAVYFNAEFFNFYELNARLLNLAGKPPRRIDETTRMGLLRKVLFDLMNTDELQYFAPIATTNGFLRVLADLIYELKQNRVYLETFERAAQTTKDIELARIYTTYQTMLIDHQLVDREGEAWLALEALEQTPKLATDVDLLLVDGYDQFTPVQAELLALLAGQAQQVVITLTKAGSGYEGSRFTQARQRLEDTHEEHGVALTIHNETDPLIPRHPDLVTLGQQLFVQQSPIEATSGLQLIEAPEPQQEVAAVLRRVKSLLLDSERPDDILIAVRDWSRYYSYFNLYARLYQLPLLLHYGEPIINNPALRVLMNALALPGSNPDAITSFRRRDVLDVLHSPYVRVGGMSAENLRLLELVSREKQVIGRRESWFEALEQATKDYDDEDGEQQKALLTTAQAADLEIILSDFFNCVTQPKANNTLTDYIKWLEILIGEDPLIRLEDKLNFEEIKDRIDNPQVSDKLSLNIPFCIRDIDNHGENERLIARDVQALSQFKDLLRGMLTTQEFLRTTLGDNAPMVAWDDFLLDIQARLKTLTPVHRSPIRSGRVLVTTANEARGLPHQHVFILGLAEGIFPAEIPEDPIYLDTEREALQANDVLLQTAAERADDDGIFYELISLPRQSLTLSRPYIRDGKPWVESHLWRITKDVFTNLVPLRIGIGEVVPADEVSSLDEAVITAVDTLTQGQANNPLYDWIVTEHSDYWEHIQHGRYAEVQRLASDKPDSYSGILQKPVLVEHVRDKLGSYRRWSATQLNEYGICPFRFFAKRFLYLEELKEPQEGLDALQLGSLNHKILEMTYETIKEEDLDITPENQGDAFEILDDTMNDIFTNAHREYNFRKSALWEQEKELIELRLRTLVAVDFSDDSPLNKLGEPRKPYKLEWKFGFEGTQMVKIPITDEGIFVRGSIDRVDIAGNQLIVVDYKTGSSPISKREMEAGRNFQMMVYLLALNEMRDKAHGIAGGAFFHIRNQGYSGLLDFNKDDKAQNTVDDASAHVSRYLKLARSGNFTVTPTKIDDGKCASYCDFQQLCRLATTNQYKKDS